MERVDPNCVRVPNPDSETRCDLQEDTSPTRAAGAGRIDEHLRHQLLVRNAIHLIAVTATANRSKGAKGPEEWRLPDEEYWCEYAVNWTKIKSGWGLQMTREESRAILQMLDRCEAQVRVVDHKSPSEPAPQSEKESSVYGSCDAEEAARELRVQGTRGEGRGFLRRWCRAQETGTGMVWYANVDPPDTMHPQTRPARVGPKSGSQRTKQESGRSPSPTGTTLFGAPVVMQLRTRPGGSFRPCRPPPVVAVAVAVDALFGHADVIAPDLERFIVIQVNRHKQPIGRELEQSGDQLPGEVDGAVFEVIADAEVAQHLKKGQVFVVANVVDIRGSEALLRAG